jgi:hypothetical protein
MFNKQGLSHKLMAKWTESLFIFFSSLLNSTLLCFAFQVVLLFIIVVSFIEFLPRSPLFAYALNTFFFCNTINSISRHLFYSHGCSRMILVRYFHTLMLVDVRYIASERTTCQRKSINFKSKVKIYKIYDILEASSW